MKRSNTATQPNATALPAPYKTDLHYCPCGAQTLPCPHHGDFPGPFWETTPDNADYIQILQSKNLPYTPPHLLIREQENETKRAAAEKALALQYPDPAARQTFLHERARSHAIRRWRSYTPRPPGSPAPDESWIDECPCGAPAPCDSHPDLWREVRYIKPSNPDYTAALKREAIPVYTPTPADLNPTLNRNLNPHQANEPVSPTSSKTLSSESTQSSVKSAPSAVKNGIHHKSKITIHDVIKFDDSFTHKFS
jgi:hypothetical protein